MRTHAARRPARRMAALAACLAGLMALAATASAATDRQVVKLRDRCDPETFVPPNTPPDICVGDGNVTFERFIAELTRRQSVGSWRFSPDRFEVDEGGRIDVVNRGGEEHSFTPVAEFGPGFVPPLNVLSGFPAGPPLPEFFSAELIGPGERGSLATGPGTDLPAREAPYLFECAIHPWMQSVGRVRDR